MVISRTPFRISFIGGGSDLPSFYQQQQGGVISTTINKYVYITTNPRFDESLRISYAKTEIVNSVNEIQHPLFRETLREVNIDSGIEVTSVADIPSGTGLGSSSAFCVGLLNALHAHRGRYTSAQQLAEKACHLEIDVLKEPIGKQDQFASAYGGLRRYLFNPDGTVFNDPIICPSERQRDFFDHIMLFYLGGSRTASSVLGVTNPDTAHLMRLRALVDAFWAILTGTQDLRRLGEVLHEGWENKKLMGGVTNSVIDELYAVARRAGALGGKLLGAGQTGFLMLFVEPKNKLAVKEALWYTLYNPREVEFGFEPEGSKIIYYGN